GVATDRRTRHDGLASSPTVLLEVIGGAADGVHRVVPDVDMTVAVEIHRISAEAARHELRQPHGTGVGALERQRIDLFLARKHEELPQLLAEERLAWRIIEAQRGQRIDDT